MNIEEINSYEDIDTYYEAEIPRFIQEILEDRVEALKHCVNYKKEIESLNSVIKEVRERVLNENKPLPSAREIIEILDKVDKDV